MRKRGGLFGAISALLIALSVGSWGSAASAATDGAEHKSRDATVSKKAWFGSAAPCSALDCSVLPPLSPYPEDTLHVAIEGGQETARTYLALDFTLPEDTEPIGGTLELPIDTDATHGSLSPEEAHMVACLSTRKFKDERGSLGDPPKADCDVRRAALYNEKKGIFTVDLDDFVEDWLTSATTGPGNAYETALALVPSPHAVTAGETWHVVMPAADPKNGKKPAKPKKDEPPTITASIEYGAVTDDFGSDLFGTDSDSPLGTSSGGTDFGAGSSSDFGSGLGSGSSDTASDSGNDSGVGSFGSAAGSTDTTDAGDTVAGTQVAAPPASLVGFAGPGFAYPIMWAFPLALLVGLAAIGRALTKDLYRRGL